MEKECKFRDCTHTNEPDCYVRECLENGLLLKERFDQYQKALKYNAFNKKREKQRQILREKKLRKR